MFFPANVLRRLTIFAIAIDPMFDVWIFFGQVDNGQFEQHILANFAVIISLDGSS